MPRSNGQEKPVQQPRVRATDEGRGAPAYVRLTQRSRPPRDRRTLWILMAVVLAAHVVLVWLGWLVLRPVQHGGSGNVLIVSLIESPSGPPPPLPPPAPLRGQPQPPHVHAEPPAEGGIQATLGGAARNKLDLYDAQGRIRLPATGEKAPAPAYSTPAPEGSRVYSGKSPLPYTPTRFNDDWAPANQSLGAQTVGRAFDKAVDKTTVEKTVKLPGGIKLHCVVSPLVLIFGCPTEAPPPPPDNDDDIRLSMPPPETLTGRKVRLPESGSSTPPSASSGMH